MRHPNTIWQDASYAAEGLERLRREYVQYLEGRSEPTSPGTISKYDKSLRSFFVSLGVTGDAPVLASVTPAAVDRWVSQQRARGLAPEGIASRLAAVKVFTRKYVWQHLELTHWDLLAKAKRLKIDAAPKPMLDDSERGAVFDAAGDGHNAARDRAMLLVYLSTGLRFAEVLRMQAAGLDLVTGSFEVVAKGGKARPVRMSPEALKATKKYLRERKTGEGVTALWTTDEGGQISYWGGQSIFRRLKKRSKVPRLHAHLLRHTFGQGAIKLGAERALVQDMLGHATDAMTRRYTQTERVADAAAKMPRFSLV